MELSKCGLCGSPACEHDPDWGGVTEYYGIEDQSVSVSCSGQDNNHCPMMVSIGVESYDVGALGVDFSDIEGVAAEAWNKLNKLITDKKGDL